MNGGFEAAEGSSSVAWTGVAQPGVTYDFANTGSASPNIPHGGSQQGVVTLSSRISGYAEVHNIFSVVPGRTYTFSVVGSPASPLPPIN